MSKETSKWLNVNTLIGFTSKRGHAWHYREEHQGDEPNHYPEAVPVEDVRRRLFFWKAVEADAGFNIGGLWVPDQSRKFVLRDDTRAPLGVFRRGYEIHQYEKWLLDEVATILDDDLGIGSAGLLKGGAMAWVSVEVPDSITTPEGVEFRPHLLAATSCDGTLSTTYKRVVQVVVCDNTLAAGLSENGQEYRVRHSSQSGHKVGKAREALNIVHTIGEDFAAEVGRLCAATVSRKQFDAWLQEYVPIPEDAKARGVTMAQNKRAEIVRLYLEDARSAPWSGTAFGILQAANTYRHHGTGVRGMARPERNMLYAVNGMGQREDNRVMETLEKVLASA